jgi:ADP-ribose pyrophosphatase YjhB (NUDIX family)
MIGHEPMAEVPRVPASAGALLVDQRGRLLALNPTYKRHWTIPGGQPEADGETPWDACRRETREVYGIVDRARASGLRQWLCQHRTPRGAISVWCGVM